MSHFPRHQAALENLAARGRYRQLINATGADFASNDYLGLAGSDLLRQAGLDALARKVPLGATGSRLLRGNHPEHQMLEAEAAAFFGCEAALFIGGGFHANQAIFSTLPMQGDLVLHDALIHASTHEGMRLGRAQQRSFTHNCADGAEAQIKLWHASGERGRIWLAVESVYSMQGDLAPLENFAALARRYDAVLVVDEAHATGLFGEYGKGCAHQLRDVALLTVHTCGKALGACGALICGDQILINMLINKARPLIYATGPSPFSAVIVHAALKVLRNRPDLIETAWKRIDHAHQQAQRFCNLNDFFSQIMPVLIPSDHTALQLAQALQQSGFDVRAIRPPTVPKGTTRLRISITGNVTHPTITELFTTLAQLRSCKL